MNWKRKTCSVLLLFFMLMCSLTAIAQATPMKQSAKLRESFEKVKTTARWVTMKPYEQAALETSTQYRIRQLEAEEAATEARLGTVQEIRENFEQFKRTSVWANMTPEERAQEEKDTQEMIRASQNSQNTTPPAENAEIPQQSMVSQSPPESMTPPQGKRLTLELHDSFQLLKQTSVWANMTPEERAEETRQSLEDYRKAQEMEGTAETPDVKQIEGQEIRSFSETNSEFAILIYATIFAAIFLAFRYLSSRMLSVKNTAVCSPSEQSLNPKMEKAIMHNDVCGNEAYAEALSEIENNIIDKGLWAKHFAETDGDENRTKARYLKSRAEIIGKKNATIQIETANQPAIQVKAPDSVLVTNMPPAETNFWVCGKCAALNSVTVCACEKCQNPRHHVAEATVAVPLSDKPNKETGDAQTDAYSRQIAVLKAIGYIAAIYVLSILAFISKFPELNDVGYLIRFVAMAFGGMAALNLSNLARIGPVTTFILIAFPIIGWAILLYYAHVNNICGAETK